MAIEPCARGMAYWRLLYRHIYLFLIARTRKRVFITPFSAVETEVLPSEVVIVGLCTCKRPKMLKKCLESLAMQIMPADCVVHIVVVDNEEQPNAQAAMEHFARTCPIPVHYVHEPRRGIATARNAVLDKAVTLGANWIAMLDDDETAQPNWLAELMAQEYRHAPVLSGQRDFVYANTPSFWEKPRRNRPAVERNTASTCNVRFSRALIDAGLRFDESLNLRGGEDTRFFRQAHSTGFQIERNERAITHEFRHPERTSYLGVIHRHYRNQYGILEAEQKYRRKETSWQFPAIAFNALAGILILTITPFAIIGGRSAYREAALRGGKHLASALAPIAFLAGHKPAPYRHVVGN